MKYTITKYDRSLKLSAIILPFWIWSYKQISGPVHFDQKAQWFVCGLATHDEPR